MTEHTPFTIEPYPNQVAIKLDGYTLASSQHSLLLIETYAPDIYIPFGDIDMQYMTRTDNHSHCPRKGDASYWTAKPSASVATNAMWAYQKPLPACSALAGHASFDFSKIETYVDGKLVRGHVRDPHKSITTDQLTGQLVMELAGNKVVDTNSCVLLHETGLPSRYYIPIEDVETEYLIESARQSVCTYKGEANYYHVKVGEQFAKNAVWSYRTPWLDFSASVGNIAGLLAFYTTAFDRVLLDGKPILPDEHTRATDAHMLATPTIDQTLAAKIKSISS